ncbi:MAG TPA: helix-turn-helix domain-containing protein [Terracidiphilus sp.]|nr:helix-turn-helix domain-containing protein [Terracidiphilus sp.]
MKRASPYRAHRERQRRRILDAAWKLFDARGIDRVTMAEITASSGVQPSTVYQYFSNKDEMVWVLLGELMQERTEQARQELEDASNALARITLLLESLADELTNNLMKVRFMAQFDAMYAREWPAERLIELESQIFPESFQYFADLIGEGIADGSLRSDLNPELTMHAVMNAVIGAQRRLASLGTKVEQEYGQPIDRMFRETIRVILMGLRAPETPRRRSIGKQKTGAGRARKRML